MSSSTAGSLSSGSDYNDLIYNLLEIKRQPIYILENRKYTYNKKINTYSDLSAKLLSLKSALDKLRISSNFYAKSVLVSDSTVLNVTLSGATPIGNYSISVSTGIARNLAGLRCFRPSPPYRPSTNWSTDIILNRECPVKSVCRLCQQISPM